MNNFLFAETVSVNNFLFAETVSVNNFLFAEAVSVNNLFQDIMQQWNSYVIAQKNFLLRDALILTFFDKRCRTRFELKEYLYKTLTNQKS